MSTELELVDIVMPFLPAMSEIATVKDESKTPKLAIKSANLDDDDSEEIVAGYYYQGEYYIIVLKKNDDSWVLLDNLRGKGYNITYFDMVPITSSAKNDLIVGWQVGGIWSDLSVYDLKNSKLIDLIDGNEYYSKIEVLDNKPEDKTDGTYEIALWVHDTGDAYDIEVYRWSNDKFILALDIYPEYFGSVVEYYQNILEKKDLSIYWYYLSQAQIKVGENNEACKSIEKALSFENPYPSKEKLLYLESQLCVNKNLFNKQNVDFEKGDIIESEKERNAELEKALKKEFKLSKYDKNIRYYYNTIDLNDDGIPEVFAYVVGSSVCGTGGCSAIIFQKQGEDYDVLSKFTLVNPPIIISDKKTNGYKDIIMYVSGGGIESFFAKMKYDGKHYPSNPSIQPKIKPYEKISGKVIIADDMGDKSGIKLT